MRTPALPFLLLLIIAFSDAPAQEVNEYGFSPWTDVDVSTGNHLLRNPWAGGLNNVQTGRFDLNSDGIADLLVFDRHGDRLLPFVYHPAGSSPGFDYAPEYRKYFPPLTQWFQTCDFNNDGHMDIFTYTPGGIMVYRHTGSDPPSFEKAVDPYLTSLQGDIFTNLLVTYVDYPVIDDLDGDGDKDILTFWGLGSFVESHRNMSAELFGHADSLVFHKVNNCWGRFAEGNESNTIILDTCVDFSRLNKLSDPKHTGSTLLLSDITGDGVSDLVLGDVGYSGVVALKNSGSAMEALITEQLPAWPAADPIKLWSFPLIQKTDLYNDGTVWYIASPFDPSLVKSQGSESVWLYTDCKSGKGPGDCGLLTRSFLQEGMLDAGLGSGPVFADVNGDGLTDLVAGNYGRFDTCWVNESGQLKCEYTGRLCLYLNNGSPLLPSFLLVDDDFGHLSQAGLQGLFPALDDLDGDGDLDLLTGNSEGDLWYSANLAGPGNLPEFSAPVRGYQGIEVDGFSTPAFADLDGDGLTDLVLGSVNGKLSFFRNAGTHDSPLFVFMTGYLGQVNVTDQAVSYTGHSVPCFFKKPDGSLRLLVGSESGRLEYYSGVSGDPGKAFEREDGHFMYISEGIRTAPAWADLNSDGYPDLAVGNYSGGITLFRGVAPGPAGTGHHAVMPGSMKVYPNPADGIIHIELPGTGRWQLYIRSMSGILIEKQMVYGQTGHSIRIEEPFSGLIMIEARQTTPPWQVIREKAMIIR